MGNTARGNYEVSRGPWHVAVLMGGWSAEREVSLMSGNGVAEALESRGHTVTRIDMDRDVALRLAEAKPDVVFNALHGVPGEDGTVQGMLDLMGLKYTHSGLVTSVDRDRQGIDEAGAGAAWYSNADGDDGRQRKPLYSRPFAASLCAETRQRRIVGRGRYRQGRQQLWQSDRARRGGAVARIRPPARRALHQGARADRCGAGRSGARGDRAARQIGLLRL